MKKSLIFPVLLALIACNGSNSLSTSDPGIEKQVEKTLSKMSLDEKIGQMIQLVTDVIMDKTEDGYAVNKERLAEILQKYKVGSFLNPPGTRAATSAEWAVYIRDIQDASLEYIGIPTVFGLDQNHGSTYTMDGTLFPHNQNLGATFNTELARLCAEATAYEARAVGVAWTFNPTIDLGRDPRWPRMWENFGEDCLVNARMGAAAVTGYQGEDPNHIDQYHIAASLKHYMGYSVPYSGKDRTPAYISPADLREKHFAPFLAAMRAGALTVMANSSSINGSPVHSNPILLTTWLKEETGWDGMLVTDWADVNNLFNREKVAKDLKDALRIAINAGIDMVMDPYNPAIFDSIKELVEEGAISKSRIDDAVRRILRLKYRLDLFGHPYQNIEDYPDFGGEKFAGLSRNVAVESMVLLKNEDDILPIKPGTKILLTGPNANTLRGLDGGWSYTWQGHKTDELAPQYNTIYESFCEKFGAENVSLCQGVTYNETGSYWEENEPDFDKAVRAARSCDVIVACIGENSYCETPGNLTDLTLSGNQRELVKLLSLTGKPVILVLNEGRPRIIADIEPVAKAVVDIMLPGNYGGDALADLLSGEENFSGKLPYTYPLEVNSISNYDYKVSEEVATMEGAYDYDARISQQWGFGYGLSYTTFEYSNLRSDISSFGPDDVIKVSVDVTNTGGHSGKESVLLYSSDLVASIVPDNKRLRDFCKISLEPGETRTVSFELKASDLAFVGFDGKWTLEEGDFRLICGKDAIPVSCTKTKVWKTANIE